ncbi:glycerophosphoryl diester phosphodiesterase membrane domain-containing protein [Marinobacter bryozoorum]|uniref:glycerophosphodiester phosphodiesterase n=1 Tax=Marinobacter bryozoorum TaxID=256324 RepID=UPI0020065971|nr:glycerophosphodiester phosphodiesterase family protein [Marinobacter bryozoorum]MCK7543237.1 glycerophosphoryl diester phosphodiesterase membrane domain-containing protein [Marinobacter bryozoorum]
MRPFIDSLGILRRHRRSLLLYHLFFTGLTLALLGPVLGTMLSALEPVTGEGAISTGGIAAFLLSPGGLVWMAATLTALTATLTLEQAGMTVIASSVERTGEYRLTLAALWQMARRSGKLLWLTVLQVLGHMVVALPFLFVIAFAWWGLLSSYEIYFIRVTRPAELWWFLAVAGLATGAMAVCNGWLFLRWSLAEPIATLERTSAVGALATSSERIHGSKGKLVTPLVAGAALLFTLPVLFTWLFQVLGTPYLALMPNSPRALLPAITAYIAFYLLLMVAVTFILSAGYSVLIYRVYLATSGHSRQHHVTTPPSTAGRRAWLVEGALVIMVLVQASLIVSAFDSGDQVSITAHRGNAFAAPENSASAIERAIRDGADYLEVDVRMTRDGQLVLWHDANLERLLGRPDRISALRWDDIRELDAGSWFSEAYSGEPILTLPELINLARDRAKLFLDLKPDHNSRDLTRKVVELLQREDAVEGTVIAAAERHVLRDAMTMEPRLRTALLAQFVIGPLDNEGFDILGLRYNQANAAAVARARQLGYELHVWTVNQPTEMSRMIDMGVDNIITDRPDVLARLLAERAELSDGERLALKLRNWLR